MVAFRANEKIRFKLWNIKDVITRIATLPKTFGDCGLFSCFLSYERR
jgi:hypothetical protein